MTKTVNLRVVAVVTAVLATVVIVPTEAREAEAAFPGQNGRIVFTDDQEIYTVKPDNSGLRRITDNSVRDWQPVWSPNGAKIAFSSLRDGDYDIYTMNPDGSGLQRITTDPATDDEPAWSPDGRKIGFASNRDGDYEIYTINADGSDPRNISNSPATQETALSWSPDGSKIAFISDFDTSIMNPNGSEKVRLADSCGSNSQPSWSPDGSKLAFETCRDGNGEIYTMNADGTDQTNLTNFPLARDSEPAWSPDGSKIAFVGDSIYVMNADGTVQEPLTRAGFPSRSPDWQPNTAPSINGIRPTPGSRLRDRTPKIQAVVRDTQTDLDGPDIKLYVDGRAKPFSYDRATNRLSHTTGRLSFGKHTVRTVARDDVGLSRTNSWRFKVTR